MESSRTSLRVFGYYSRTDEELPMGGEVSREGTRANADDSAAMLTKHFYPSGPPVFIAPSYFSDFAIILINDSYLAGCAH